MEKVDKTIRAKVSIILPVYNERDNIASLVGIIQGLLQNREHEIIIMDDHSRDGSFEAAAGLVSAGVKVFTSCQRLGLAASIRNALMCAEGNEIVIMDSDFNHDPQYLPFMIDALSDYDCIVASRFLPGGAMDNRLRYYLSALFNIGLRRFTSLKFSDSLYGFLAFRKDLLKHCCYADIFYGQGDYCMRLLYYLQHIHVRFFEFPAVNGRRRAGRCKMRLLPMLWRYVHAAAALKKAGRMCV